MGCGDEGVKLSGPIVCKAKLSIGILGEQDSGTLLGEAAIEFRAEVGPAGVARGVGHLRSSEPVHWAYPPIR